MATTGKSKSQITKERNVRMALMQGAAKEVWEKEKGKGKIKTYADAMKKGCAALKKAGKL